MKILVVDENATNRKYLRVLLRQEGDTVLEGNDGIEALEILEREPVDAVISDILMPRMDGYRLCYEIRKNPKLNPILFIAYTAAYTSPRDERLALDFGADKYLSKPALPEVIIKALHEAVKTKGGRAKQFRKPDELSAMKEYSEVLVRKLEETNSQLSQTNEALNERAFLAEFNADVSKALNRKETLRGILHLCAEAMVHHLEAAFARIWTYNENDHVLELQASAGMYTHINGGHARVPVGQFKIGLIASERKPHLTNSVIGDPRVNDQEWAKREGMVSFAGYPLIVEERLVGVMAMFAKKPLSQNALDAMASVAKAIAAGIERKQTENELHQSDERFRELAENIREIFFIAGPDGTPVHYVSPAFEEISGRSSKGFEGNPGFWLEMIHPDDRDRVNQAHRDAPEKLSSEYRMVRPDGSIRWIHTRTFPVQDEAGKTLRIVGIAEDITDRKRAEEILKTSEQRLRNVIDGVGPQMFVGLMTPDGKLIEANQPALAAAGLKPEDVLGKPFDETYWWSYSEPIQRQLRDAIERAARGESSRYDVELRASENQFIVVDFMLQPLRDETGKVAFLVPSGNVITDRKRAEEKVQQNLERIRALHEIATAISSTLDLRTVLNVLLEKIEIFLPIAAATTVRLLNDQNGELESLACRGLDEDEWKSQRFKALAGRGKRIVESKAPLAVRNIQTDARTYNAKLFAKHNLVSYLGVPLIAKENVLGVLGLYTNEVHEFTDDEVEFLTTLAGQAAIAIHNARLYAETDRSKKDLETTNQYLDSSLKQLDSLYTALTPLSPSTSIRETTEAILDRLIEATGADAALIRVRDQQTGTYVLSGHRGFPTAYLKQHEMVPAGGAVDWVVKRREPIIAPYIASDPRFKGKIQVQLGFHSAAMFPFEVRGEVRGVVHIASRKPGYFDDQQRHHLMAIARQMSIALENKDLYENLRRSKDELEKALKVKDEFLSVISHELKTPINIIMGYSALGQGEAASASDGEGQGWFRKIESQANNLLGMVNSTIAATQIESRSVAVAQQPVDVGDLIAQLKSSCDFPRQESVSLIWQPADGLPTLLTDYEKLQVILRNLISNALKFTEHGTVTVSTKLAHTSERSAPRSDSGFELKDPSAPGCIEFKVSDTGLGIPEESLSIIFDLFKQVDSSTTRAHDGLGLGLYITKKYCELLGGKITVESAMGKGSTFTVAIPINEP